MTEREKETAGEIAKKWLASPFLERYRRIGERYLDELKGAKKWTK